MRRGLPATWLRKQHSVMRFLTDMGISPATAAWLRALGHDAIHLRDEGLNRLADPEVLQKAGDEKRILVTCDLDFGYLVAVGGLSLPSIILFRLSNMLPDNVELHLVEVLDTFGDELSKGCIIVVSDKALRVRALPIGQENH